MLLLGMHMPRMVRYVSSCNIDMLLNVHETWGTPLLQTPSCMQMPNPLACDDNILMSFDGEAVEDRQRNNPPHLECNITMSRLSLSRRRKRGKRASAI